MVIVEIIDKEIERLEAFVKANSDTWESIEEDRESMNYDGAGNYFGHTDDCFDAGTSYGQWLEAKESLEFLKKLRGGTDE